VTHDRGNAINTHLRTKLLGSAGAALLIAAPALGAITIDGDVSGVSTTAATVLNVGGPGYGRLRIDGGSDLVSSTATVGGSTQGRFGPGFVDVAGFGSTWTTGVLRAGASAVAGEVTVSDGGRLVVSEPATFASVGPRSMLRVSGSGSTASFATLAIGADATSNSPGSAGLEVSNGGVVSAGTVSVASLGRVTMNGGQVSGSSFTNNGDVRGSGTISTQSSFINGASLLVDYGNTLSIESRQILVNTGRITLSGGELRSGVWNNDPRAGKLVGTIELTNGTLRSDMLTSSGSVPTSTNSGLLASLGGDNHVYGQVSMSAAGQVVATGESRLTFHDDVSFLRNSGGGLTVQAGSKVVFLDGLTMGSASALQPAIANRFGPYYQGIVEVVGATSFNETPIDVLQIGGFVPTLGDSFAILTSTGPITGTPVLRSAPPLAHGQRWDVVTTRNQVLLRVVDATPGDFNADGVVNAADYTAWRDNSPSASESTLNGAGSGDGVVNAMDYAMWVSHYSDGSPSGAPVPEPAACATFALGLSVFALRARRLV
jgi:hypothetical protein